MVGADLLEAFAALARGDPDADRVDARAGALLLAQHIADVRVQRTLVEAFLTKRRKR